MNDWTAVLNSVLGVPESPPKETEEAILKENEAELGLTFPKDYVAFGLRYGPGEFHMNTYRGFGVGSPFLKGWRQSCEAWYKNIVYIRDGNTTPDRLALFPERGGLLPFASPSSDCYFCWKTVGDSETWPVVSLWDYNETGFLEFQMGFAEFWVKFLRREIIIPCWEDEWDPARDVSFEQWS